MERMIDSLSMCLATPGKISEICTPEALVAMGLKPLFALTSQESRWLRPPSSHSRIQALALPGVVAAKASEPARRNRSRCVAEKKLSAPARRNDCRVMPGLFIAFLMIIGELPGTNYRPYQSLQFGLPPGWVVRQQQQQGPLFSGGRLTAQGS